MYISFPDKYKILKENNEKPNMPNAKVLRVIYSFPLFLFWSSERDNGSHRTCSTKTCKNNDLIHNVML